MPPRRHTWNQRKSLRPSALLACALLLPALAASQTAIASPKKHASDTSAPLPLGNSALSETRTQTPLATGVTLTTITRGTVSENEHWTLGVLIPTSGKSSSLLASREQAQQVVTKLQGAGFTPELREERNPGYRDHSAGILGYSVRVGTYASRDAARTGTGPLSNLGYRSVPLFTGEDGGPTSGPWTVRILTIDPRIFQGEITATHGSSIAARTTVSSLARQSQAMAAVNGGFFVMSPSAGVTGEPAGLFVDRGKVLSEATNGRVTMNMFNRNTPKDKTHVEFQELTTRVNLVVGKNLVHRVDGINRKPGLIRNCGGTGDAPTDLPRHDFTCTDADELVAITPEFGAAAPAGEGIEAVIDDNGTVTELRSRTGGAVPTGGMLIQGTGAEATWLTSNVPAGTRLRLNISLTDRKGKPVKFDSNDSAVNGGPRLVVGGRPAIQAVADGLVNPDDPSFLWNWGVRRNPRTMAGVDRQGRVLLVTVDGHRPGYSLGLSLVEGSQVMTALGAVSAINLDGGGSTTMVINGQLAGSPSDPGGERAVGDAIIVKAK